MTIVSKRIVWDSVNNSLEVIVYRRNTWSVRVDSFRSPIMCKNINEAKGKLSQQKPALWFGLDALRALHQAATTKRGFREQVSIP